MPAQEKRLRKKLKRAFRSLHLEVVLRRPGTGASVDEFGDTVGATPESYSGKGMLLNYEDDFRVRAGIPETDVKVTIFATGFGTTPNEDDQVQIRDTWHQIRSVDWDPILAAWACQSYEIEDPTA